MTAINRATLPAIRKDIDAALAAVAAKHGIDFTLGRIIFTETTFRGKLEAVTRAPGQTVKRDPKEAALASNAVRILGSAFVPSKQYKHRSLGAVQIVGYNSRAKKYPFIVQASKNNQRFKIDTTTARTLVLNPV